MSSHDEIIRSGKEDYGGKICECCKCMTTRKCTFNFDYYPIEKDGEVLLQCERCLLREHFGTPCPPMTVIRPDGEIEVYDPDDLDLPF